MERGAEVLLLARENCQYSTNIAELLESDSRISLTSHMTRKFLETLPPDILGWQGDYILSFRNTAIVPQSLLDQSTLAAVNFHPGPVAYPGSGAGSWALLEGATSFGVTAHLMAEKVDSGPVIAASDFPISSAENSVSLLKKTHETLHALALEVIPELLSTGEAYIEKSLLAHERLRWANTRRRMATLNSLRLVPADVSPERLHLLVRALHTEEFPLRMIHHGHEFVLKEFSDTQND
jgi:methionyl-tRNA formyltransferase